VHRADQVRPPSVLEEIPVGAGLDGAANVAIGVVRRQHQDLRAGTGSSTELAHGRHAVAARHPEIHQHDIGIAAPDHHQRLRSVARLTHDDDARLIGEHAGQPVADHGMIIDDDQADGATW